MQWYDVCHMRSIQSSKQQKTFFPYQNRREEALRIIEHHVDVCNAYYQLDFRGVFVRNQKTRWGSCSSRKNLMFNYRIAYLPEHLRAYVIVHELCHLKELNHGKKFWALIAETIPHYQHCRRELRAYHL